MRGRRNASTDLRWDSPIVHLLGSVEGRPYVFQGALTVSCDTTHSKVAVEETTMNDLSLQLDPTVQTVQNLIDLYDKIGIPHFQRGLVWNGENTSLLLESLYFDTPCGTIILWKPREPSEEGVPLSMLGHPEYLVIDGQQRIRCLWSALGPGTERSIQSSSVDEGDESGENGEPGAPRVWCLNLTRVPDLTGFFDEKMSRFPIFRFAKVEVMRAQALEGGME